jgi:hypothetical protein
MASMMMPVAATNVVPQNPAFVNMISLFLSAPNGTSQPETASLNPPATKASPAQIAESMIRSMLSSTATQGALVPTAAGSSAAQPKTNQAAQSSKKVSGSVADVPTTSIAINTLVPVPVAAASPVLPPAPAQPAQDLRANVAAPARETLVPTAPATKNLPNADIAFTAILTPIKPAVMPDTVSESPEAADEAPGPAIPASNGPQPQVAQSLPSEAGVRASTDSSNAEAGGGASQQQQDDTPAASPHAVVASTDPKARPADEKLGDSSSAGTMNGAGLEHASGVTSLVEMPTGDQTRATSEAQSASPTPFQGTAEALRTSESNLPAAPQPRTGAAQEISIRIAQPDASPVDLRVVERAGQVHVDVRTSDPAMQTVLRQDLGSLTSSLERAGYHSETFTSSSALERTPSSAQTSSQDDRQDPSQKHSGSGDFSEGRRQQQQQKRSSTWLEELEDKK